MSSYLLSRSRAAVYCSRCSAEIANHRDPLTARQSAIIAYIRESFGVRGYAPSFEEIAEHFRYHSLSTVHEHLSNLERKGWITRRYNEARSITLVGEHVAVPS